MKLFKSTREFSLWLCAFLVVLLVYASIPVVRPWVFSLTPQTAALIWAGGMAAVAGMVLVLSVTRGAGWQRMGVGLGLIAVCVLLLARVTSLSERSHLIEYAVIALLIHEALIERSRASLTQSSQLALAIKSFVVVMLISLADETIQWGLPGRVFDLRDMLFNAIAAGVALTGVLLVAKFHQT